jgi:hypothetical protein
MVLQKCNLYFDKQIAFYLCQNCRASDKYAVSICFSTECASFNGNHPIRYCQQCHNIRHNNRRGGDHIVHTSLPQLWDMDAEVQIYMVESIVRYSASNFQNVQSFHSDCFHHLSLLSLNFEYRTLCKDSMQLS